jgi:hypothetical protein
VISSYWPKSRMLQNRYTQKTLLTKLNVDFDQDGPSSLLAEQRGGAARDVHRGNGGGRAHEPLARGRPAQRRRLVGPVRWPPHS